MYVNNKRRIIESIISKAINKILSESTSEDNEYGITWDYDHREVSKYVKGKKITREYWLNIDLNEEQLKKLAPRITKGGKTRPNTSLNGNRVGLCFTDVGSLIKPNGGINLNADGMQTLRSCLGTILGRVDEGILSEMVNGLYQYAAELEKGIEIAEQSTDELWNKLLEKFESEEIQELLKNIKIEGMDDTIVGHRFSTENKLRALAQNPNATYLATKKQWTDRGRAVNDGAKPIFLYGAFGSVNNSKLSQNLSKVDAQSLSDVRKRSIDQHRGVKIASLDKQGYTGWQMYYDISETTPLGNDFWDKEIGYKDNLRGVPNDYTMGMLNGSEEGNEKLKQAILGDTTQSEPLKFTKAIANVAQEVGAQTIEPSGDDEKSCSIAANTMLKNIVIKLMPKHLNLIKQSDPKFIEIANGLTTMLMLMCNFTPRVTSMSAFSGEITKGMRKIFTMICDAISKNLTVINRGVQSESIISNALQSFLLRESFGSGDFNQDFMYLYAKLTGEEYYEEDGYDDGEVL